MSFDTELVACMPMMRRYALFLTRDRETAQDLVQDTIVRALTYRAHFEQGSNMVAWLNTIMHRLRIDSFRRNKISTSPIDLHFDYLGGTPGNQETIIELKEVIELAKELTPCLRKVFPYVVEGYTKKETAKALGYAPGTIGAKRHYLREKLRAATA